MFYSWNDLSSGAPPPPQPGSQAQEFIPPNCLSLQVCYTILCIYFTSFFNFVKMALIFFFVNFFQDLQRQATAVVAFGNVCPVLPGSNLWNSILNGEMAVKDCLRTEFVNY